jgi:hypothetical protein
MGACLLRGDLTRHPTIAADGCEHNRLPAGTAPMHGGAVRQNEVTDRT